MSGEDIIQRVNEIKELIIRNPDGGDLALKYCDYLIDDIYLYRKQFIIHPSRGDRYGLRLLCYP